MATEKKARKPRTVDPDIRLAMVNEQIDHFERLVARRQQLLAETEALAQERRVALEKSQDKLEEQRKKRDRILRLKERREAKAAGIRIPSAKQAELAELASLKEMLAKNGMNIDDVKNMIQK